MVIVITAVREILNQVRGSYILIAFSLLLVLKGYRRLRKRTREKVNGWGGGGSKKGEEERR
jgi:hypothetical protein